MWKGLVRPAREQSEHDHEILALAGRLQASGYELIATAVLSPRRLPLYPDGIAGCRAEHCRTPDLFALDAEGKPLIIEVETEGTIGWSRTRCQMTTFPKHGRTMVMVPWAFCPGMKRNLQLWGIGGVEVRPY